MKVRSPRQKTDALRAPSVVLCVLVVFGFGTSRGEFGARSVLNTPTNTVPKPSAINFLIQRYPHRRGTNFTTRTVKSRPECAVWKVYINPKGPQ